MNESNETMILRGFNIKDELTDIKVEQPHSDCTSGRHHGMPVTAACAPLMIDRFRKQVTDPAFANILWVEFSKASIFRILAQEKCEYIRFYFAIPAKDKKDASLVLEGVDCEKNTIKLSSILTIAHNIDEQGAAQKPLNEIDENRLLAGIDVHSTPQYEEKGNGGGSPPIHGIEQIKFMSDFIVDRAEVVEMSTADFIKTFYEYAKEKM